MRATRTISTSLAAVLGVAALAGPAAAGQQGANDSAKANVYVPPSPQPIGHHVAAASPSSSGFDWGSAGIGAAAASGLILVAVGAAYRARIRIAS